jgi:hypothetical protein
MWQVLRENKILRALGNYLLLFSSVSTLLCCALPATLVMLGLGSALAGVIGHFPQLIWISEHKELTFSLSAFFLFLSYLGQRHSKSLVCVPERAKECESTRSYSRPVFYVALVINAIGAFYAFILPRLM